MVAVGVGDRLQIAVVPGEAAIELEVSGRAVPAGPENLVYRAADSIMRRFEVSARVEIALEKVIPSGAGLGGGSSDAAATLRILDELLELGAGEGILREIALGLGADVPFFVTGRPALVSGIGEVMSPLASWPDDPLVVAFQGAGLATEKVYAGYDASLTSPQAASNIPDFPRSSGSRLRNDLEEAASRIDPGIKTLKESLRSHGAREVGMSGSGSAVFGFFRDEGSARSCAERLSREGIWAEATRIQENPSPIERVDPGLK